VRAAEVTLSYAFFAPAGTFPAKQMEQWAQELEKRTDGRVEVQTFPGGTLLGGKEMYDGVDQGVADIGLGSPSYDPGRFPMAAGLSLPHGFPNATVASLTYWDLVEEFSPAELEPYKIVTLFTTEPGHIMSRDPVASRADIENMKLRAAGTAVPALEALGAAPVGIPMPGVPEAVQTGVVDGLVTSREVMQDFKLAENLGYVTDYPTVVVTFAAVMKRSTWEALPEDVQAVINELNREMAVWTGQYHDQHVADAMEWSRNEHGVEVVELSADERDTWQQTLEPMIEGWAAKMRAEGFDADRFLARLNELRDQYAEQYP